MSSEIPLNTLSIEQALDSSEKNELKEKRAKRLRRLSLILGIPLTVGGLYWVGSNVIPELYPNFTTTMSEVSTSN